VIGIVLVVKSIAGKPRSYRRRWHASAGARLARDRFV